MFNHAICDLLLKASMNMILKLCVKHNAIDLMKNYEPGKGDPLQYAKSFRPNAFAAEEAFLKVWHGKEITVAGVERLHITINFDHGKSALHQPNQKLAKMKKGYSSSVYLGANSLCNNGFEKPQMELQECIVEQVEKIVDRLRVLRRDTSKL